MTVKQLMMLLTLFLVSCRSKIIRPIYQYENNRCRVLCFDYGEFKRVEDFQCGEDFSSGNFPPILCDGVVGPDIDDYALYIKPRALELVQECRDKD